MQLRCKILAQLSIHISHERATPTNQYITLIIRAIPSNIEIALLTPVPPQSSNECQGPKSIIRYRCNPYLYAVGNVYLLCSIPLRRNKSIIAWNIAA